MTNFKRTIIALLLFSSCQCDSNQSIQDERTLGWPAVILNELERIYSRRELQFHIRYTELPRAVPDAHDLDRMEYLHLLGSLPTSRLTAFQDLAGSFNLELIPVYQALEARSQATTVALLSLPVEVMKILLNLEDGWLICILSVSLSRAGDTGWLFYLEFDAGNRRWNVVLGEALWVS